MDGTKSRAQKGKRDGVYVPPPLSACAKSKKTNAKSPRRALPGQPTKYRAEYSTDEHTQGFIDHCKKNKEVVTLCGYAVYIDVSEETIAEWGRVHPKFSGTIAKVKRISKSQLYQGGLNKGLSSRIVKLGLSANHGMIEKTATEVTGALTFTQALDKAINDG